MENAGKNGQFANDDLAVWQGSRREFQVIHNKSDGGYAIKDPTLAEHLGTVRESLEAANRLIENGQHQLPRIKESAIRGVQ